MDTLQPALQLYSVRSMDESLMTVIRKVSNSGYQGVEFGTRIWDSPIEDIARVLTETETTAVGVHADLEFIEAALEGQNDLIARCHAVGCQRVVMPHLPISYFRTKERVRSLADRIQTLADALGEHGLRLGIHNVRQYHWPLFPELADRVVEKTPYSTGIWNVTGTLFSRTGVADQLSPYNTGLTELMKQTSEEDLHIQAEVAELQASGFNPITEILNHSGRIETIHLRDIGPSELTGDHQNVAHGTGTVDLQGVVDAAEAAGVEWLIYENELEKKPEHKVRDGAMLLDRLLHGSDPARVSPGRNSVATID